MQDYFANMSTQEAKLAYRELYKANSHNAEIMEEINAQLALCVQMNAILNNTAHGIKQAEDAQGSERTDAAGAEPVQAEML